MKAGILRWSFYLAALLVFGPLAGSLLGGLRSATGGADATPLLSTTPALGIALALGAAAARIVGTMAGLTTAGLVVAWAAWRTGTVDELVRTAHTSAGAGRPLISLAIEGLIFGAVAVAIAIAVRLAGGGPRAGDSASPPDETNNKAWLLAIPAAILAGGVAAAFLAGSPLKGQAVAAAIAGGVGAGAAVRLITSETGRRSMTAMFIAVAALAILGPLSGVVMAGGGGGGGGIVQATYKGTLFPLALITPLDWIAGGLLGIPLGVSWAGSMMEKKA